MAAQHRFITTNGTVIWFADVIPTPYSGTGTPWTTQATTPFQIAMNTVTGAIWTPQAPQPQTVYGGGPPFRHGSAPVYGAFPNVTEAIPIQIRGETQLSAITAMLTLRQELQTALAAGPLIFVFHSDGATNEVRFEVSSAVLQETPDFINQEAGRGILRANITITRQPLGGVATLSTGQISSSLTNATTGSPPLLARGDMSKQGIPYNLSFTHDSAAGGTQGISRILAATISGSPSTSAVVGSTSTSSTTGVSIQTHSLTENQFLTNAALIPRYLIRFTSMSANAEVRIRVQSGPGTGATPATTTIYTSPWIAATNTAGNLLDMGTWAVDALRGANITSAQFAITTELRSTNGALATVDHNRAFFLKCFTFCRIDNPSMFKGSAIYSIEGLRAAPNGPYLPSYPPTAYVVPTNGTGYMRSVCAPPRGTTPRIYGFGLAESSLLWMAWYRDSTLIFLPTETITNVTRSSANLFFTLRGAD